MKNVRLGVFLIGIFLVGLGIYALVYEKTAYKTEAQQIEFGPVKATIETEPECVRLPPIFGALVIIAGGILVAMHFGKRKD